MSGRFCAECGNTGVELYENFCEVCYWKYNTILEIKKNRLEIPYCLTCFGPKLPTGWAKGSDQYKLPEVIAYGYMRNLIHKPEIVIEILSYSDINWLNPNPEFIITYQGISDSIPGFPPHTELVNVDIKLIGGICKNCVRKKTGTHDVTVQVRAKERKLTKFEIDTITKDVFDLANNMYQEQSDSYVSDIIENHGGIDIYLGNNALATEFVAQLRKRWVGHHEKNFKLITEEKDNKRVYRTTHLYRIPHVSGGEWVEYEEELYQVISVNNQAVKIRSLRTHSDIYVKDWEEIQISNPPPYQIQKLVISEDTDVDSYLIMDLQSYISEEFNKSDFPNNLPIGNEVTFLLWKEKIYLPIPEAGNNLFEN